MSFTLTDQLRAARTADDYCDYCVIRVKLILAAADEIERLRKALRDVDAVYLDAKEWYSGYERIMRIAKDALLYPQGKRNEKSN